MTVTQWLGLLVGILMLTGVAAGQTSAPAGEATEAYKVLQERPDRLFVVLPNRLLAIVQEVHTAPVVSVQVWVKTGSIYEQEHVGAGLSHFLEHLLAGGTTTTRSQVETRKILGEIGAQFNAQTSQDNVHYYINTTSDHAALAVGLISDWMQNSTIPQSEYQREGQVIQREFDIGEGDPSRVLWKLTEQAAHKFHPARHPTIGYIDEFLSITRDEIYDFYRRMYVPNNIVVVVVGDVRKKAVVEQIAKLWADKHAETLPKLEFPIEPEISEPRNITGTATIKSPRLTLAWPGTRIGAPDDYALDLLGVILGQGESSRLARAVRDEAGAVTSISAYNLSFAWGEGFFGIDSQIAVDNSPGALPSPDAVKQAVLKAQDLILSQVERVRSQGVTEEELARAKRQVLAQVVMSEESADGVARKLATDLISMGDPDFSEHYGQAVQQVTRGEVQAAADRYLRPQRLIAVTLLPPVGGKIIPMIRPPQEPKPADLKTEPVELDNIVLEDKFSSLHEAGPATQPAPAVQVGQIHRYVLSNGLRLLVQRNTLTPAVSIQLYQLGGLLSDDVGKEGVANAAAAMLVKGTATLTAQQIAKRIEDLGAELSASGGANTIYVRANCLKDDWATILELTADVTLHPTFPDKEWSFMKKRISAGIDREKDTWGGELRGRFREVYFGPDNTWSQPMQGRKEAVEAATADDLAKFYRDHLGAIQTVLAVFGDVDEDQVAKKAELLFAGMPGDPLRPFVAEQTPPPKPGLWEFSTNKPLAAVQVGFGPAPTRKSLDYAPVQVLTQILGAFPSGWLVEELRGKGPGLVYATGAGLYTGLAPGYIAVTFNTQPATAVEALRRTELVIRRAADTQVDEQTLNRAKASVLTDEFFYKQSNSDRAADAALNELYGLGLDAPQKFLAQVRQLDAQRLQIIAQTYLRNPVAVVLSHQELPKDDLARALGLLPATQPAATEPATTAPAGN